MGREPGELPARLHRAFNQQDLGAWREILAEDVDLRRGRHRVPIPAQLDIRVGGRLPSLLSSLPTTPS